MRNINAANNFVQQGIYFHQQLKIKKTWDENNCAWETIHQDTEIRVEPVQPIAGEETVLMRRSRRAGGGGMYRQR